MGAEWLSHHCLQWCVAAPSAGTSGPGHLGQQLLPWALPRLRLGFAFGVAFGNTAVFKPRSA